MKILGRPVADKILAFLKRKIQNENLKPCLAIFYVGTNPNSKSYITYKVKAAEKIGVKTKLYSFSADKKSEVLSEIRKLNEDFQTNGIIIQLPLPEGWDTSKYINSVLKEKDVDGFIDGSPFFGATACGIWEMICEFGRLENKSVDNFLKNKKIVIVGKGITAGKPAIGLLKSKNFMPTIVDSKTKNPDQAIMSGDIVIGASGIKNIIHKENIKKGAYVVAVGVGRELINREEQVFGDVNENISEKAKMYCPTLGGIGPLTIACLLQNVVRACENQNSQ